MESGIRVGHYEITASIGAGGMGKVFRAQDTRLNRDVAWRRVPEQFDLPGPSTNQVTRPNVLPAENWFEEYRENK